MAAILKSKMAAKKTQIPAWQTTYHNSGSLKEHFGTVCQLLPKMFSESHFRPQFGFCPLTMPVKLSVCVPSGLKIVFARVKATTRENP